MNRASFQVPSVSATQGKGRQVKDDAQVKGDTRTSLSVAQAVALFNAVLEESCPTVTFHGEIQQITRAPSGHIYLTLKDETAQLAAVMWGRTAERLTFRPQAGLDVTCRGRPNVYERTGKLQVVLTTIEPRGEGLLQKRFFELKERLAKEGLFSEALKQPLPYLPRAVGIVTSAAGAAVHDIMVKLSERMPCLPAFLIDVRVQGDGAAAEIAAAIERFNRLKNVDVLIVGRGGGSLEDLWAFNEEVVVRAIARSAIPIISAVGHEVDITLADLAADVRAPTPTGAAELVVPRRTDLLARLDELHRRLENVDRWFGPKLQAVDELAFALDRSAAHLMERARNRLFRTEAALSGIRPTALVAVLSSRLHSIERHLDDALRSSFRRATNSLEQLSGRLSLRLLSAQLNGARSKLDHSEARLRPAMARQIERRAERLAGVEGRLESVSPLNILKRGYAIVEREDGSIVASLRELPESQDINVRFSDGKVAVSVHRSGTEDLGQ